MIDPVFQLIDAMGEPMHIGISGAVYGRVIGENSFSINAKFGATSVYVFEHVPDAKPFGEYSRYKRCRIPDGFTVPALVPVIRNRRRNLTDDYTFMLLWEKVYED